MQDPIVAAAETAMARMRSLELRPTPRHFAAWYACFSGQSPALRRVIGVPLSNGRPLDGRAMEEIHDRFLGHAAGNAALQDTPSRLQETMREVIDIVTGAGAEATRYGTTLHEVSGQVDPDPRSLPAVVARLLDETEEMARRNEELGRRLADPAGRIGELERRLEEARREAATDALTGLPSRRAFEAVLREHAGAAIDSGRPALAERIRTGFGGCSFTVRATGQTLGSPTLSVGVARHECGEALPDFVRRADAALYEAKRQGRDRVVRAQAPPLRVHAGLEPAADCVQA